MVTESNPIQEPSQPGGKAGLVRSGLLYSTIVIVLPLLLIAAAFPLAKTSWFLTHDKYPWLMGLGYGRSLVHADCDVVVFGDSSALSSIDPRIVGPMTHMKTCNIADTGPVRVLSETRTLDVYLSQNARPKYVVFMYSPWAFHAYDKTWDTEPSPIEGIAYTLFFDSGPHAASIFLRHLKQSFEFVSWVGQASLHGALKVVFHIHSDERIQDLRALRNSTNGYYPFEPPGKTACSAADEMSHVEPVPDPAWATRLHQSYSAKADHVLLDLAPMPSCDPLALKAQQRLSGAADNELVLLPVSLFSSENPHPTTDGAKIASRALGEQIMAIEQRQASKTGSIEK